jgi:tetratricopeptide (TPR) repeat protein
MGRRYRDAIAQAQKTIELNPGFSYGHGILAEALEMNGDPGGAVTEFGKAYELSHDFHLQLALARAFALKGERDRAIQLREQSQEAEGQGSVFHYGSALLALALNNRTEALDQLEQSYRAMETSNISMIRVDPRLDPLRGDPRFEKLANAAVPLDQNAVSVSETNSRGH